MKNKFMLGAASGITTLLLAVPVLAQVSSAQETSDATTSAGKHSIAFRARAPLSQEDVQSLIERDTTLLANIDAMVTLQKSAVQARLNALTAAASITDETARQEAVQAANEAYRTTMQDALEANPDLKAGMHMGLRKGPHEGRGQGHELGSAKFTEKLGMTKEELKAALDSGKTIEQILEEKGIELPMRKEMRGGDRAMRPMGGGMKSNASSAQ